MKQQQNVLVVDDEPGILRLIKLELEQQGFDVHAASDAEEALRVAAERRPDIAVLDIMLPGMSGMQLMSKLRETGPLPVVMLTARDSEPDKVRGLEAGADDYIAKPFSPDELSARLRAVLRRATPAEEEEHVIRNGDVEIDLTRRLVKRRGEIVQLSRTEWMLLQHLAMNPGKIMLNAELLHKVWGAEYCDDLQYLRVWVSRIRRKIEDDPSNPKVIKTFQGVGYMLVVPGQRDPREEADETAEDLGIR